MTKEEIRQQILEEYPCIDAGELEKDRDGQFFCPLCDQPELTVDAFSGTWLCSSCGRSGNAIDLYMIRHASTEEDAIRNMAAEMRLEWPGSPLEGPQSHSDDFNGESRATTSENPEKGNIFNPDALNAQTVFVAIYSEKAEEIIAAGYPACGINEAPKDEIREALKNSSAENLVLIGFRRNIYRENLTASALEEIAKETGKRCRSLRQEDGETLKDALKREYREAMRRPDNIRRYISELMRGEIEKTGKPIATGFRNMDKELGGLYPGLYMLVAPPSLGKTTFALQLADQLAAGGQEVLFFSLEQSRLELAAKSIARTAYKKNSKTKLNSTEIRTEILTKEAEAAAAAYMETVGERLSIIEGNYDCTADFIARYVADHGKKTKTRPVVVVDYLQILQPAEAVARKTTREIVDQTVTALRRLARDQQTPVLVISSVGRRLYNAEITLDAPKESGGAEFSADVVLGLQLENVSRASFKESADDQKAAIIAAAKAADRRQMEVVCLKNRNGKTGGKMAFDYIPAHDCFLERK